MAVLVPTLFRQFSAARLALQHEVIRDLVKAVPREGEHEEQRLRTGASERVPGIGGDVYCAAGTDRRRVVVDLHLPLAADDVIGFLGLMVMNVAVGPRGGIDERSSQSKLGNPPT